MAADPARGAFFFADLRFDASTTAIGVFRNTAPNLIGAPCPAGTHTLAQANGCFTGGGAARRVVAAAGAAANFQDKPHLAVDERAAGVGAGNVYITFTHFTAASNVIQLVNCGNSLVACSVAATVSGGDASTQFSHVTVRNNGVVAITWINGAGTTTHTIRHRQCNPPAVPGGAMACGPTSTVHAETQALRFGGLLGGNDFRIATYPVHDQRISGAANITTVVWSRCKIPLFPPPPNVPRVCLDADTVLKEAAAPAGIVGVPAWPAGLSCIDTAPSNPALQSCANNDQIFPWIRTDRSRNINAIAYYTSFPDAPAQHRLHMVLAHRGPGAVNDLHTLTTVLSDPCGDPIRPCFFIGDYIGVASRGTGIDGQTRDYISHTYNILSGNTGGVLYPNTNNHMSRFDH